MFTHAEKMARLCRNGQPTMVVEILYPGGFKARHPIKNKFDKLLIVSHYTQNQINAQGLSKSQSI